MKIKDEFNLTKKTQEVEEDLITILQHWITYKRATDEEHAKEVEQKILRAAKAIEAAIKPLGKDSELRQLIDNEDHILRAIITDIKKAKHRDILKVINELEIFIDGLRDFKKKELSFLSSHL